MIGNEQESFRKPGALSGIVACTVRIPNIQRQSPRYTSALSWVD